MESQSAGTKVSGEHRESAMASSAAQAMWFGTSHGEHQVGRVKPRAQPSSLLSPSPDGLPHGLTMQRIYDFRSTAVRNYLAPGQVRDELISLVRIRESQEWQLPRAGKKP